MNATIGRIEQLTHEGKASAADPNQLHDRMVLLASDFQRRMASVRHEALSEIEGELQTIEYGLLAAGEGQRAAGVGMALKRVRGMKEAKP